MRGAIYYSLCCNSCGCCECFYVLPPLMLLLLSVLRLLRVLLRTAAAAATLLFVVMDFRKSVSRRRQKSLRNKMGQPVECFFWTCRAGVRIYLGSSFSFLFPLPFFLPILKSSRFVFGFNDLVICDIFLYGPLLYVLQQQL